MPWSLFEFTDNVKITLLATSTYKEGGWGFYTT